MSDWFNALLHYFVQLPLAIQALLLLGLFDCFFGLLGLLFLVALHPSAGRRIVAFLTALRALARSTSPTPPRRSRRPRALPPAPTPSTPLLAPGDHPSTAAPPAP
jgi:cytochrome b561